MVWYISNLVWLGTQNLVQDSEYWRYVGSLLLRTLKVHGWRWVLLYPALTEVEGFELTLLISHRGDFYDPCASTPWLQHDLIHWGRGPHGTGTYPIPSRPWTCSRNSSRGGSGSNGWNLYSRDIACNCCNRRGHKERDCWTKQRQISSGEACISKHNEA